MLKRRRVSAGAALLALGWALATPPARAADAPDAAAPAEAQLDDIVVTAEKRPQSLQKTPISISVLGAGDLANRHVQSLLDLSDGAIPSLRVAPFYSRGSALIVNIRGVGVLSDGNQPARDQGVGVYIDGVYLGRAQGLGTAIYDVASIEVLKGPQGTLFGRNTEGGAVSITTRRPSGEFHLSTTAGVGNYGSYKAETHVDLPRFHDFSVKLDAIVTRRGGLIDNPQPGQRDFNAFDKRGLHAELLWQPAPNFSADYAFDTSYDASTPLYLQSIAAGSLARAPLQTLQPDRATVANVGVAQQDSVGKTHGHRLTLGWQVLPTLELKSIGSYRALTQSQYDNGSANSSAYAPNGTFARYSLAAFTQHQFSEELQAIGETGRLKYLAGALYYQEKVEDNAQAFNTAQWNTTGTGYTLLPLDYAAQRIDRASHVTTRSIGAFGQATYTPAIGDDMLHLTAGARWTRDSKKGQLFIVNGATPNVNGVIAPRELDAAWSRVDPMVTLAVDASRDVHVYGKWSQGYKSGGANSRSLTYAPFKPESVSMFELGAKTEFLDRHARLNVSGYAGTYKDIQIDFGANYLQIDPVTGRLLSSTRTTIETTNAPGKGRLRGVEADLSVTPLDGLTLSASYAYTHVSIPATVNPFPQGATGVLVTTPIKIYSIYTPEHAASGSIDYELPLNGFTLHGHLDANYDNGFYVNYNDPAVGVTQPKGEPAFVVNGRLAVAEIGLGGSDARLGVSLWVRNLFDEQHLFYKTYSTLTGTSGFFNDARTWGAELTMKF